MAKAIVQNGKATPGFLDALNKAVDSGYVTTNRNDNLVLYNYSRSAQYDRVWNWATLNARGLVLDDKTNEVVALPFEKFFNYLEDGRRPHGHIVEVTEKMDGSLGILYRKDGQCKIATRGSFASEQAIWATKRIPQDWHALLHEPTMNDLTLMFEIIYPQNRVVVDYKGAEMLVLLAARNRANGKYAPYYHLQEIAERLECPLVKPVSFHSVTDIIEATGIIDHNQEGWVVLFSDGKRFKFKGNEYRELHALFSSFTIKNIFEAYVSNNQKWIENMPDELYSDYELATSAIEKQIEAVTTQITNLWKSSPQHTVSRKEFARWVKTSIERPFQHFLFAILDERDTREMVIAYVRPGVKDLFTNWKYG